MKTYWYGNPTLHSTHITLTGSLLLSFRKKIYTAIIFWTLFANIVANASFFSSDHSTISGRWLNIGVLSFLWTAVCMLTSLVSSAPGLTRLWWRSDVRRSSPLWSLSRSIRRSSPARPLPGFSRWVQEIPAEDGLCVLSRAAELVGS